MKKLKISDVQDFRIYVEETIEEDNLFFHEYEIAVDNLNKIWKSQKKIHNNKGEFMSEYPNNIIAFCGERGSGKSSVMMSFMNAILNSGSRNNALKFDDEIQNNDWSARIVIDPSMFDGVHNIVDIVLAHIYQSFSEFYDQDNQKIDKYKREEMLNRLAKTYKSLSIIKNKEKILDDEYDVAGNIAKLHKLGESTQLKDSFKELIDLYLEILSKPERSVEKKRKKLLVAIDDLDLCSEHAYDMAEQIRKYFILPNVIILMAIKIDQLEMGVEEKNRESFKGIITVKRDNAILDREMQVMAERYVTKLIPTARRVYLPKLKSKQVQLEISMYLDNKVEIDNIENIVIRLIREKTGMIFIPSNHSYNYFVPVNLRELVNFITVLKRMKQPDNSTQKLENIYEFRSYFVEEMLKKNISRERLYNLVEFLEGDDNTRNWNLGTYLDGLLIESKKTINVYNALPYEFPSTSLASVIEKLNLVSGYLTKREDYQLFYYIKVFYTVLLNEGLQEGEKIFDSPLWGFLWGNALNGTIPAALTENNQPLLNRDRFFIHTLTCWNAIADALNEGDISLLIPKKDAAKPYVSGIKGDNKISEIICWMLLALLACPTGYGINGKYIMNKDTFVYNNHMVSSIGIAVSVENYFVNLCYLEDLYRITMLEFLGISWDEMSIIISSMKNENAGLIEQSKNIFANVDLSMRLLDYCKAHGDYKEATSGDRTYLLIKQFFKNVSCFMEENKMGKENWSELWIPTSINDLGDVKGTKIDICKVYVKIFEAQENIMKKQYPNTTNGDANIVEGQMLKRNFSQQVENISLSDYTGKIYNIPRSLRNRTSNNVKATLENIANAVQKYTYKEKKYPEDLDVVQLIRLYSEVVDLYIDNPQNIISERQYDEYKAIAKIGSIIV